MASKMYLYTPVTAADVSFKAVTIISVRSLLVLALIVVGGFVFGPPFAIKLKVV